MPYGSIRRLGPSHTSPIPSRHRRGFLLELLVNRRRGQILTIMVSIAAIASFGSVVWWAHNQDVKAGGRGLEPLVVQAPTTPSRIKPENAGGLVPPNQDKEVFNRIAPNAVPTLPEKLLPGVETPKLPAAGLPAPAAPKQEATTAKTPTPVQATAPGAGPTPAPGATTPGATAQPASATAAATNATTLVPTEAGPTIASLIENMSGPTGGWRVQIASVKSEDVAKSTWARLQSAHGDVLANLRMQAARVDLGCGSPPRARVQSRRCEERRSSRRRRIAQSGADRRRRPIDRGA